MSRVDRQWNELLTGNARSLANGVQANGFRLTIPVHRVREIGGEVERGLVHRRGGLARLATCFSLPGEPCTGAVRRGERDRPWLTGGTHRAQLVGRVLLAAAVGSAAMSLIVGVGSTRTRAGHRWGWRRVFGLVVGLGRWP